MHRCSGCRYPSDLDPCAVCAAGIQVQRIYVPPWAGIADLVPTLAVLQVSQTRRVSSKAGRPARHTPESLTAQIQAWAAQHGRAPTTTDLNSDPALPYPKQLHTHGLTLRQVRAALGIAPPERRRKAKEAALAGIERRKG